MRKINLGKSELSVSQLGLGCINFGTTTSGDNSFRILDAYVDHGGNFLDTSNNYAVWNEGSAGGHDSERVIGSWLASSGMRERVIIATKIGALPTGGGRDFSSMEGLARTTILKAVEDSLLALKTEYVDLLYLHVDDFNTPQEETLGALNELIEMGVVREIGCSNFRPWRIERARRICDENDYQFFCAVQQRFSYLSPALDADFAPQVSGDKALDEYIRFYKDLTMVAHTSLLYGIYNQLADEAADIVIDQEAYDTAFNRKKLAQLKEEMKRTGVKNAVPWVLSWITKQFGGSVVLSTTSNPKHLVDNINYIRDHQNL